MLTVMVHCTILRLKFVFSDSRDRRHYARHSHFELKNLRAGMPPEAQKSNSNDVTN